MAAIRFATTQLRGLHAAGRTSDLQHPLISALLARHLGERYASLFAEFEVRGSDSRDWFVPSLPAPVQIANLSPERQAAIRAECGRMIAAVNKLAATIEGQGGNGKNLARVLRDVTVYPDEDLWEYKGAPLVLNWGFRRTQANLNTSAVIADEIVVAPPVAAANDAPPEIASAPPEKPRFPWNMLRKISHIFLWLLFVGLLASTYMTLLPACGVAIGFLSDRILGNCARQTAPLDLVLEGLRLQNQIERAQLDIAQQQNLCMPLDQKRADREFIKDADARIPSETPRGETEIALIWEGTSDLDLIIECPDGKFLWRDARTACGGNLLQDMNRNERSLTSMPIEHAAWTASPARGTYKIYVELYSYRTSPEKSAIPFKIGIKSATGLKLIEGQEISGLGTRILASSETF